MNMKLYPESDGGPIYAALVTVPLCGAFAALLLYEWCGNTTIFADTTMLVSKYVGLYSIIAIVAKLRGLYRQRKRDFMKSRIRIVWKTLLANVLVFGGYLFIRFFFG